MSSSKIAPSEFGFWVAFERAMHPGPKAADLALVIERCRRADATWVAPRAGAGGGNDAAFDDTSMRAYLDAGLRVYPWIFPYVGTDRAVVAGFRRWFDAGAHGAILNAEFEYQPATAAQARALVALIRSAWAESQGERVRQGLEPVADECFLAHAPPDYLGAGIGHPLSDELVALDEVCDHVFPQIYAWEHDDRGHPFHVERVMRGYEKRGLLDKVSPVGCTYRPKTRGFRKDPATGKNIAIPTPEMANEDQRLADDFFAFLEHDLVRASTAPSGYSADAISWIGNGNEPLMLALERHAALRRKRRDTGPIAMPQSDTPRPFADAASTIRAGEAEHTIRTGDEES